jgi:hypothetical protein
MTQGPRSGPSGQSVALYKTCDALTLDRLEGIGVPPRPQSNDPERVPIYGGISGITLAIPEFVLCDGLVLCETYAHVMAPYILAPERAAGSVQNRVVSHANCH